jgi:hypothetical protein
VYPNVPCRGGPEAVDRRPKVREAGEGRGALSARLASSIHNVLGVG